MSKRPFRFPRGEFEGELITRLAVKTLFKIVANDGSYADKAMEEIKRRKIKRPMIVVSDHAVNQASTRLWELYRLGMDKGEGIVDWLLRLCESALQLGTPDPHGEITTADGGKCIRYFYQALIFLFTSQTKLPVLITVMTQDEDQGDRRKKRIEVTY